MRQVGRTFGCILMLIYGAFIVTCLGFEVWGGHRLLTANIGPQVRDGSFDLRKFEAAYALPRTPQ